MKSKFSSLCLVSFVFCLLSFVFSPCALSQVPEGFNYQAIARDGSGEILAGKDMKVIIALHAGSETGTLLWQEEHTVISDQFGLVSLVVGSGTRLDGLSYFTEIDWKAQTVFLKTTVEYPIGTPHVMGTTQIWAVPYSLVAKDVESPVKKLGIKGTTIDGEEALFEVRNTDGQIVFAVYNEGIRAYVNEIDKKGVKGGFAIGGFGTKEDTEPQNFLFVSGDSVRVYIDNADQDPIKGPKGGFAIGGFGTAKTGPQNLLTVSNDSVRIYIDNDDTDKGPKGGFAIGGFGTAKTGPQKFLTISNDSVRIYVDNNPTDKGPKGGFAIGGYGADKGYPQKLLTVSNDSIRIYIDDSSKGPKGGFAIGGFDAGKGNGNNANFFNVATSDDDTINPSENRILWYPVKNAFLTGKVLIELPDSVGVNSFATGFESKAVGDWSQAMGYLAVARGAYSTAIGNNAIAHKDNSFAFGDGAKSMGLTSFSFGKGSVAKASGSYAFGYNALASAQDAFAFGTGAEASGIGSFALGFIGRDSAGVTTDNTKATVDYAVAIGMGAQAIKKGAISFGLSTIADAEYSLAMGYKASSTGYYAVSIGNGTISSNFASFASGWGTQATSPGSVAMGLWSKATTGTGAVAIGSSPQATATGAVAIGYGTKATANHAVAFGQSYATGSGSFATGTSVRAKGINSVALNNQTTAVGTYSTATGYRTKAKPYASFAVGWNNDTTVSASGATSWVNTDPLFMVGNGYGGLATNAMTVYKNGNAYIQGNLGIGVSPISGTKLYVGGDAYVTGLLTIDGSIGMGGDISASGTFTGSGVTIGNIPITMSSGKMVVTGPTYFADESPTELSHVFLGGTFYDVGRLNIETWEAPVAMFNRRHNDGVILSFYKGDAGLPDPQVGNISVTGSTVSYNAFTGSHYGTTQDRIEEGKLVVMNGSNSWLGDNTGSEVLYGIAESSKANDPAAMGAFLGILESMKPVGNTNPYLIMAEGNGEMWIVDNGENLQPGDFLISSTVKGHAMKDKGEFAESYVIAKVAEPVDWQNVTEAIDGIKHYKVSVLFTSFVRNNNLNIQSSEIADLKSRIVQLEAMVEKLMEK